MNKNYIYIYISQSILSMKGVPVAKVLGYNIGVNEFGLQSHNYINFLINTLRKGKNSLLPVSYGLHSTTTLLLNGFGIK